MPHISVIPLARRIDGTPAMYFASFRAPNGYFVFRRSANRLTAMMSAFAAAKSYEFVPA